MGTRESSSHSLPEAREETFTFTGATIYVYGLISENKVKYVLLYLN